MKKLIALFSMVFILGCQGAEEKKTNPQNPDNTPQTKPVNGVLTLERGFLNVGSAGANGENIFEGSDLVDLRDVKTMTKDYYFVAGNRATDNYRVDILDQDKSTCKLDIEPRFFLIVDGVYTDITVGKPFTLTPQGNYRLQVYMGNMSCLRLKVSFRFATL